MNRKEYLDRCAHYLGRLSYDVRAMNAIGHFDINRVSEDFFVPVLRKAYNCPELKNQNQVVYNFPAVDLGDETAKISFQVTSDGGSGKVIETLKKFRDHRLEKKFSVLYILVITQKQSSYTSQLLKDEIAKLGIAFDTTKHIVDVWDVANNLSTLIISDIQEIYSALRLEFEKKDRHLQFRENLEKFLEFARSKVDIEKNSKKYVPSIFMETHSAKEEMRFFAHPLFFHRKIDDCLARVDLTHLNKLLSMASQPLLKSHLARAINLLEPTSLDGLTERLAEQEAVINDERALVAPFSYYAKEQGGRHSIDPAHETIWSVVKLSVEGTASGIFRQCDKALQLIELTRKKIFLVTGMAGQGKTNFVCDLVDNQFSVFEIPNVFVPARELNAYPGPNRIFSFLTNNRYAPKVSDLHELLELFNKIAQEMAKPFVIAIDGINEVSALDEFNGELKIFLSAVCQYESVKVILTCRSEFFDSKFASIMDEPFNVHIHKIADLKSKMSEESKGRMLESYLSHFRIRGKFLPNAANFLKNDLLLVRVFCELNENSDIGRITDIYKGDLFEGYLHKKFAEFPERQRPKVLPALYKLVASMMASGDYAAVSLADLTIEEIDIVQALVAGDVVLRQEVPGDSLSAYGKIVVSFTYDELRDFIFAHYLINVVHSPGASPLGAALSGLQGRPPYEGVFKFVYALARRKSASDIIEICEASGDFSNHYALNLSLLPPDLQEQSDLDRVTDLLSFCKDERILRWVASFLYHQRDKTALLNISVLVDHLNALNGDEHELFMKALFSDGRGFGLHDWRDRVNELMDDILRRPVEVLAEGLDEVLVFFLHAACFADWRHREALISHIFQIRSIRSIQACLDLALTAKSDRMKSVLYDVNDLMAEG